MLKLDRLKGPYIIAEIGCNHNGDLGLGKRMIDAAKACGASAVKFQFFSKSNLATEAYLDDLENGNVKLENVDKWETSELNLKNVRDQIAAFTNSKEELKEFREYCIKVGIDFGCTPVDLEGISFLKEIDSDFIKISSMDLNNPKMIQDCANSELPLIISTGMSDLAEIDEAYRQIQGAGITNFALLHCVSIYPPQEEIINLKFIDTLENMYDCEIGYSDHSLGFSITLAAIAKGVRIIEKHFTLDKNMPGWDHKVSADEQDLKVICQEGKRIFRSLGSSYKTLSIEELEKRKKFRRSLTTSAPIKAGQKLSLDNITFKRPGTGISPDLLKYVIGRSIRRDIDGNVTLYLDDLE